jgi:hypothetical protein
MKISTKALWSTIMIELAKYGEGPFTKSIAQANDLSNII